MTNTATACAAQLRAYLNADADHDPAALLALASLAAELLTVLPQQQDPRFALAYAQHIEAAANAADRAQIHAAHLLQAGAAHGLDPQELERTRTPEALDWTSPSELTGGRTTFKSPETLLSAWLNINYFDARDRVRSANQLIAQFDFQHLQHPAKFTRLAERFADPRQRCSELASAARRLQNLEPPSDEYSPITHATARDDAGNLMEDLIDVALEEPDATTRRAQVNNVFKRVREEAVADENQQHTGLFDRGSKSGLQRYELLLGPLDAEYFASLIAQADNPRTQAGHAAREPQANVIFGAFGRQEQASNHPDFLSDEEAANEWIDDPGTALPSVAQRRLNALMNFLRINSQRLRHLLKSTVDGASPSPIDDSLLISTVAPKLVVTLTLAELEERASTHGITAHGRTLSATELRQMLASANIIPMVLGGRGEVLDVGRGQRYHTDPMRLAIRIRDGGCIVPGCTMDPESCSVHHIWLWSQGGVTSVFWGAMLCETHHHDVHAGLIKVIPDGGVPKVIMPSFMDPAGTPVRNTINRRRAA
ncbi:HNH endonuclease signature motif containing protein [Glutamicibacter sp.]|uniref:HNH endonuclease signature motif containing protein n=1 Tax=Glutamicibacter sp. TaxID=1931995 RepID=UPI0028BD207C|nr:HNH endonuclease signature motif containing protein [Glutamicibacter sp.]